MPDETGGDGWEGEQGPDALMSYRAIMTREIRQAEREIKRPAAGLIGSGLVAGFGIGVSVMAVAAVHTSAGETLPGLVLWLLSANAYTLGFILVILARTDLFTE